MIGISSISADTGRNNAGKTWGGIMLFNNIYGKLSFIMLALILTAAAVAWAVPLSNGLDTICSFCPVTQVYLKPVLAYSSILVPLDILLTGTLITYLSKRRARLWKS